MPLNPFFTRKAIESYEDVVTPSNFFTSFYKNQPVTDQLILSQDIIRKLERVAIDVTPHTGEKNIRKLEPFTNKEYQAPAYDEALQMGAAEFNKRVFGQTSYTPIQKATRLTKFISDSFVESRQLIERAIELQAVNALLDGQLTLSNGDVISYHQKATHQINNVDWTAPASDIITDIKTGADLIRKDGKGVADILVLGSDMLEGILVNTVLKDRLDNRRIDIGSVKMPELKDTGAAFHGMLSVDSYKYELWTYPQSFEDASDVTQDYLPAKKAVMLDSRLRMDLNFTGVYRFTSGNSEGVAAANLPLTAPALVEFFPYAVMDNEGRNIQVGVESHPLCVPVAIDKVSIITSN